MNRGFFGIGIVNGKFDANEGQLLRSAHCFGADFLFMVGSRYKKTPTNTTMAQRHIPLYEYHNVDDLLTYLPYGCQPVCIELKPWAQKLENFCHPEEALYILGQEDGSLPDSLCAMFPTVQIPTQYCLNVCVAGSIVMYDRIMKQAGRHEKSNH